MVEPFLGQITYFPYNFAPTQWAMCAGQIVPIQQFTALFSLLGTQYGGNGTSNFALPDLRGRTTVSQGQLPGGSFYAMGEMDGVEFVSLNSTTMAPHSHFLGANTIQGTTNTPGGALLASPFTGERSSLSTALPYNVASTNPTIITLTPGSIAASGMSQPHNNMQPSLVLTPCIALAGVFPARN